MREANENESLCAAAIEVSVVLPCLNEVQTLAECIQTIQSAFEQAGLMGEVVVADNGSTDGSRELAVQCGARVVLVAERGYGHALRGGIAAARGKYVVFGDADGSYDFLDAPRLVDRLRQGDELVMGNRFQGRIHPGAMPWLHRYIGNPVLSRLGRVFFNIAVGDFHCGLRGFSKAAYNRLELRTTGMEFASELVIRSSLAGLKIGEIPVDLHPDGRGRPPHLQTWRDGWRHLRFMLSLWRQWSCTSVGWTLLGTTLSLLVAVLLVAQIWRSGWCNDESAHIPAGLYHLETGHMDAYRVNPPLPRMLAAIPLLIDHPKTEWFSYTPAHARNEYTFAHSWLQADGEHVRRQLRLARSVMLLFFAVGAWAIFQWAKDLYGRGTAWLALTLWSLSPDVITYSATVAPDLPAAATGLLACYWYWKWLVNGKSQIPWEVCLGVALATLCKFSWLFLFPLLPCLTWLHDVFVGGELKYGKLHNGHLEIEPNTRQRWRYGMGRALKLTLALSCTVVLINVAYGFEGTFRRLGDFEFLSTSLGGEHESRFQTDNRYRGTWLGAMPVPLPSEMLQGIDYVKWEFENGMPCYLLGEWKFRGWWYFYLVAMAVKFPVGTMVLIAIGAAGMLSAYVRRQAVRGEWLIPLVAVLFIVQVSSQTGFTHHLRYVLPAFGFLYLLAARCLLILPQRIAPFVIGGCLVGTVAFHATHTGLAHTHFNWLVGGPTQGWRYLSLSNVDWGQSTYRLAHWAREHPELHPMTVVFVSELGAPSRLVADLGMQTSISKTFTGAEHDDSKPSPGWYLMSAERLTHEENGYFRKNPPHSWPYADVALFYVPSASDF